MGSPVPRESPDPGSNSSSAAPETLARLVLRCRELSNFLEASLPRLPARDETPFLYGQLDETLQRLQSNLRQVALAEPAGSDKNAGFLRRLSLKKPREQGPPKKGEPRYDLQGNAWTIPVTELVGFLSHSGKSGLLWVTSPAETFVLEFSRGNLVHATSNAPPVTWRLGEILLSEALLTPSELAEVIDYAKAADDLLGSYLVRTGRLQHSDLQRALAIQVQQLFHRLMDAENALYRFQDGAQLLRSQSLEVNITHLLLESARRKDEERQAKEERVLGATPRAPETKADKPAAASKAAPEKASAKKGKDAQDVEALAALPDDEEPVAAKKSSGEPAGALPNDEDEKKDEDESATASSSDSTSKTV